MSRERSNWRDKGGRKNARNTSDTRKTTGPYKDSRGKDGKKDGEKTFSKGRKAPFVGKRVPRAKPDNVPNFSDTVRLNKYLANSGICTRREADVMIHAGTVTVNDVTVTELGVKINPEKDVVKCDGAIVRHGQKHYILLNKPKGFLTTMDDPYSRRTVMQLVKTAAKEAVFPVDKLDRQTTGLLLFTNDGDLMTKLTHPTFKCKKIFQVTLNKKFSVQQLQELREGILLEDGPFKPDAVDYVGKADNTALIGIEFHTNKKQIITRTFEYFGCKVVDVDRVYYAGFTKKDLPRGKYRKLTEQELINLKMMK